MQLDLVSELWRNQSCAVSFIKRYLDLITTVLPLVKYFGETGRRIERDVQHPKASVQLALDKLRSALIAFVCVLLEDSTMMLTRVFAAFNHEHYQAVELRVCVIREVDMLSRLTKINISGIKAGSIYLPSDLS